METKPEPWWPLDWRPGGEYSLIATRAAYVMRHPSVGRVRVYNDNTHFVIDGKAGDHDMGQCEDELELRAVLLTLAYPESKSDG